MGDTIQLKGRYEGAKIFSSDPLVAVRDHVISPIECTYLIELAKPHIKRAGVVLDEGYLKSDGRTGSNHWLKYDEDSVVDSIGRRLADIVGLPLANAESMQVIHYGPTQEYRPHFDAFNLNEARGQRAAKWGGQRLVTALVYLNQPEGGGSTSFPKLGIEVPALPGRMVIFHNTTEDISGPHPKSLHAGMPVESGEKWAFNLWFRHGETSQSFALTASDNLPMVSVGAAGVEPAPTSDNTALASADPAERDQSREDRLTVVSNRADELWQEAVNNLKRRHDRQLEAARVYYWDTYANKLPPEPPSAWSSPIKRSANRSVLNPLSDQQAFARLLKERGCAHLAPATFESIDEVIASQPTPEQLWFIKSRMRAANETTLCVPTPVLVSGSLPADHVVQAGVSDLQLIEGRKFTCRFYMVVVEGTIRVFNESIVFIHGAPYVPTAADFKSQIDNKSYRDTSSGIAVLPTSQTEHQDSLNRAGQSLCSALRPVLDEVLEECSGDRFTILALDTLLRTNGQLALIRVNSFPNFMMTREIDKEIHVPLFEEVLKTLIGRGSDRLSTIIG